MYIEPATASYVVRVADNSAIRSSILLKKMHKRQGHPGGAGPGRCGSLGRSPCRHLRGGHDAALVGRPVAAQHLRLVALQHAARLQVREVHRVQPLRHARHCAGARVSRARPPAPSRDPAITVITKIKKPKECFFLIYKH